MHEVADSHEEADALGKPGGDQLGDDEVAEGDHRHAEKRAAEVELPELARARHSQEGAGNQRATDGTRDADVDAVHHSSEEGKTAGDQQVVDGEVQREGGA